MPPALLLMRFARFRWLLLPFPIFLLWPLLLLAWMVVGLAWVANSGRPRPRSLVAAVIALRVLGELHGTRVDIRGGNDFIFMQFV